MSEGAGKKRGKYNQYLHDPDVPIPRKNLKLYEKRTGHRWEDRALFQSTSTSSTDNEVSRDIEPSDAADNADAAMDFLSSPTSCENIEAAESEEEVDLMPPNPMTTEEDEINYILRAADQGVNQDYIDIPSSDEYNSLGLGEQLFHGTDITVGQALLNLTIGYKKYKWTKTCLNFVLNHIVNFILPQKHNHPTTLYKYLKIVEALAPNVKNPVVKYHCNKCINVEVPTFNSVCEKCETKQVAVHVQNDLPGTIKDMFEHHHLAKLIDIFCEENETRLQRSGEIVVTDVCDGTHYLKLKKNKYDLCLIQNCDGFPVFGSATAQIWPNFLTIMDIPLRLRKQFVVLANLWYAYKKPDMHEFLNPFVETMNKLATEGVNWINPLTKQEINSKVFVILSVADAQARSPMQNLNACTGFYSCSFCEIQGQNYKELTSNTVYYPYSESPSKLRNKKNMLQNAVQLHEEKTNPENIQERKRLKLPIPSYIKGVKGFSCLAFLNNFDIGASFTPEYMHSCLLGVVKSHLMDILSSKNKDEPFYIGLYDKLLSKYLNEIKPPSFITRMPRDISVVKYWKASEFRNWLLYYSLPCLEIIWKNNKYFEHFALLVFAIHTLLKSEIKAREIAEAESAIKLFCSKFSSYYGKDEMTFNMHMLLHYTQSVIKFGPLFGHSAFIFENENGILKERVHGTGNIAVELVNTTKILNSIRGFQIACQQAELRKNKTYFLNCNEDVQKVPGNVLNFLITHLPAHPVNISLLKFYLRLKYNGTIFTTESYSRSTRSCSYYFLFKNALGDLKATKALYYVEVNEEVKVFLGKRIILQEPRYSFDKVTVKHLLHYEETDELVMGFLSSIISPLVNIDISQHENNRLKVMCIPPNLHEINL